jgi:hypothetical protein
MQARAQGSNDTTIFHAGTVLARPSRLANGEASRLELTREGKEINLESTGSGQAARRDFEENARLYSTHQATNDPTLHGGQSARAYQVKHTTRSRRPLEDNSDLVLAVAGDRSTSQRRKSKNAGQPAARKAGE